MKTKKNKFLKKIAKKTLEIIISASTTLTPLPVQVNTPKFNDSYIPQKNIITISANKKTDHNGALNGLEYFTEYAAREQLIHTGTRSKIEHHEINVNDTIHGCENTKQETIKKIKTQIDSLLVEFYTKHGKLDYAIFNFHSSKNSATLTDFTFKDTIKNTNYEKIRVNITSKEIEKYATNKKIFEEDGLILVIGCQAGRGNYNLTTALCDAYQTNAKGPNEIYLGIIAYNKKIEKLDLTSKEFPEPTIRVTSYINEKKDTAIHIHNTNYMHKRLNNGQIIHSTIEQYYGQTSTNPEEVEKYMTTNNYTIHKQNVSASTFMKINTFTPIQ
ncbi:MAG: hypothetical protein ACLFN8_05135 [Candidatus Woesearchaeota archaeon]